MGLNFSHGSARWSYGGFNDFRMRLADKIGIELESMEGFGGTTEWSTVKDDIVPLLNHSDCDGDMSPEECDKVAPRLRELVSSWDDLFYDKRMALELADAMEECARSGETLEFW